MYLVTAATDFEMLSFQEKCRSAGKVEHLVTGIGPVESAVRTFSWLSNQQRQPAWVLNFGIGGAYFPDHRKNGPRLLDICLAEREVLGDLGICLEDHVERFSGNNLVVPDEFSMDRELFKKAEKILALHNIPYFSGTFVTVSCASGTAVRGNALARQYNGICENMEGAAIARVCMEFSLPCLELRCISNMVEDRDPKRWQLKKACQLSGEVLAKIVDELVELQSI